MGTTRAIVITTAALVVALPAAFLAGRNTADDASASEVEIAVPAGAETSSTTAPVTASTTVQPLTDGERYACGKYKEALPLTMDQTQHLDRLGKAAAAAELSNSLLFEGIALTVRSNMDEVFRGARMGVLLEGQGLFLSACMRLGAPQFQP